MTVLFAIDKKTNNWITLINVSVTCDNNYQLLLFQFDVREDEEQNVKLSQTIELLLAAGYFRARIKGLSPFDKVGQ